MEGLHGLALGGPGGWGRPMPIPTTQFAQDIGMGETWDPDLIRQAGGVEGEETRYIYQSEKTHRGGLVVRAPNADLGRDPRWGRTEECFGEDPFFNGTMVTRHGQGLAGRRPEILAHRLADEALPSQQQRGRPGRIVVRFRRAPAARVLFGAVPHGRHQGGSRAYMAAYNARNSIPMTVNPILQGDHGEGVGRRRHHLHRRRLTAQHGDRDCTSTTGHSPKAPRRR